MPVPWPEPASIAAALMVLLRVSMIVILMPVIGHQLVPAPVKAGLIGVLTVLLVPVVPPLPEGASLSPIALAVAAVREMLIAGALALLSQLIFAAAQFAGQIMSFQMGMTVANVFDPATSSQQSVISQLALTLAMLVWLAAGAHHVFLQSLADSFRLFPVGRPFHPGGLEDIVQGAAAMFVLAVKLAAPVMLLLTFIYIALGLLARAVPQIQVFFVSFPLTVGLGLLTLALGMPAIVALMHEAFSGLARAMPLLLRHLGGG